LLGDQCFWGQQIGRLGLGPAKPVRMKLFSEDMLFSQLKEVFDSPAIVENAKKFGKLCPFVCSCVLKLVSKGEKLRSENGTFKTVRMIERLYAWMAPRKPLHLMWDVPQSQSECGNCKKSYGFFFNTVRICGACGKRLCSECLTRKAVIPNRASPCFVCIVCNGRIGLNGVTQCFNPD
jgi:hypothetical protein